VDPAQGRILWEYGEHRFPFFSSPAPSSDRVVFGGRDKRLHCVTRDEGAPVWTFQARGKIDSSPVICGQKVVVGSDDGRLYVVSITDGKELWSYEIGEAVTSSPAVASGMIVVGCEDGSVYAFGAGAD
jgi:outer membrane protein assembly factor BamB